MRSLNNLEGDVRDGFQGFEYLSQVLEKYIGKSDKTLEILEIGAKAFKSDLDKLPGPMSKIRKSSYTHLIKTFTYERTNERNKDEVLVGWGKKYGRMVENGTEKMDAIPHFYPVFDRNKEKYYNLMLNQFYN